jgi:hypothetical protein
VAVGPWDRRIVHGAAVAALFAGRLEPPDGTLARLTIELLRPVPMAPLVVTRKEAGGGSRVQRWDAVATSDGREVAAARAVVVRRTDLDLPPEVLDHPSPFDPTAAPPLDEPNRAAEEIIGWPSFDSRAIVFDRFRVEGDDRIHQWIRVLTTVIEGTELSGAEVAVVAADYAQSAVFRHLPMSEWSYRNAELTVHLARAPVGPWIGMRSEALVQPVGAGWNAADLFDAHGRVGRSAATLVVERRAPG